MTETMLIVGVVHNTRFNAWTESLRCSGDYDTGSFGHVGPGQIVFIIMYTLTG